MNTQNHVTSVELSKRLRKLGVPQKSIFFYSPTKLKKDKSGWDYEVKIGITSAFRNWGNVDSEPTTLQTENTYSAFLCSELGDILRKKIEQNKNKNVFILETKERNKQLMYRIYKGWANETEVEDRAKLLIYLIENKLIDVKNST